MKHQIFTFSAISHDPRYLQSHTIWQNKGLNLTNLIYFIIYVDKNTEKGVKMVIYEGEICSNTLYIEVKFFIDTLLSIECNIPF